MSKNDSVTLSIRQLFIYQLQLDVEGNRPKAQIVVMELSVRLSTTNFYEAELMLIHS